MLFANTTSLFDKPFNAAPEWGGVALADGIDTGRILTFV